MNLKLKYFTSILILLFLVSSVGTVVAADISSDNDTYVKTPNFDFEADEKISLLNVFGTTRVHFQDSVSGEELGEGYYIQVFNKDTGKLLASKTTTAEHGSVIIEPDIGNSVHCRAFIYSQGSLLDIVDFDISWCNLNIYLDVDV